MISPLSTPERSSTFDSILVVGPNILEIDEFLGVMGVCENSVLDFNLYRPYHSSIPSLAFETSYSDVIRLDPIHACHRYLTKNPPKGDFFCCTLNRNSVSDIVFCYILKSIELVPGIENTCCIVPVSLVIVCEEPLFEICEISLNRWKRERWEFLKIFWIDEKNIFSFGAKSFYPGFKKSDHLSNYWRIIDWTSKYLSEYSRADIFALLIALMCENRVMIVSESQVKRSAIVLCLWAICETIFPYPHPVLPSSPAGISTELPNAPTPMIAGIPPHTLYAPNARKRGFFQTIFAQNNAVYAFCPEVVLDGWGGKGERVLKNPERIDQIRKDLTLFVKISMRDKTRIGQSILTSQAYLLSKENVYHSE